MAEQVAVNPAAGASSEGAGEEIEQQEGAGPGGESIANAADPDAALAAEEDAAPKKRKLKLGDKEVEFDEDVAALIEERNSVYDKRKEHTRAANERFQQAAEMFKKIEGIDPKLFDALRNLQNDPWAVHRAQGVDPAALVTDFAKKAIAEQEMSPEQRQFAKEREALDTRARQVQEQEQKIQNDNHQREIAQVRQDFAKNLPVVLEKFNLPDDEYTAGEIGKTIAQMVRQEGRPPTPADYEEAAEMQAERLETQLTRYLDRLSRTPGSLKKKFPEIAKRLREEDVASVTGPKAIRPGKPAVAPPIAPSRPKTYAEEEAEFRRRKFAALNNGGRV